MQPGLWPELAPKKVEYLKYLRDRDKPVKTGEISAQFGVDPSTVTKAMNELASAGLVSHVPYHGVCLTPDGIALAGFLTRRHRILGLVLTHYGLDPEEACEAASRFESFVPKEVVDTICRSMGHPTTGICGRIARDEDCCRLEGSS